MKTCETIKCREAVTALEIACSKVAAGARDLRRVAAEAAAEAYCLCVAAERDEVESRLSAIHAELIEGLRVRLCTAAREQN